MSAGGTSPAPDADARKVYFLEVKESRRQARRPVPRSRGSRDAGLVDQGRERRVAVAVRRRGLRPCPKPACGPLYRAKIEGGKARSATTKRPARRARKRSAPVGRGAGRSASALAALPAPAPAAAPAAPSRRRPDRQLGRRPTAHVPALECQRQACLRQASRDRRARRRQGSMGRVWQRIAGRGLRRPLDDGQWSDENDMPEPVRGSTCDPDTKQKFKDFKIEAEFNLDEGQNSGLYLRGRYELQLMLQAPGRSTATVPRAVDGHLRVEARRRLRGQARPASGRSSRPSSSATTSPQRSTARKCTTTPCFPR